jgi:hypothetical protein
MPRKQRINRPTVGFSFLLLVSRVVLSLDQISEDSVIPITAAGKYQIPQRL